MGRPAKAAALKVMEGRGRNSEGVARDQAGRPINEGPSFQRLIPQAPEWLSPRAREVWEETVDELGRLKLTKPIDGPTLVAYVTAYDTMVECYLELRARKAEGLDIVCPALRAHDQAAARVVRFATELGCTPASEQRLPGGPKKGDDGPTPFDPE
jgi:P27 family predicted phage terminase small subunit